MRAPWKPRPKPRAWRAGARRAVTSVPSTNTRPWAGTNPLMALSSVDFPAPLVPIRPTNSPRSTCTETWSTAVLPPKRTDTSWVCSAGPEVAAAAAERPVTSVRGLRRSGTDSGAVAASSTVEDPSAATASRTAILRSARSSSLSRME